MNAKLGIKTIRDSSCPTPVTQEEVAYQLFEFFSKENRYLQSPEEALPFFAKCMLAVRDPESFIKLVKPDHLNPRP